MEYKNNLIKIRCKYFYVFFDKLAATKLSSGNNYRIQKGLSLFFKWEVM